MSSDDNHNPTPARPQTAAEAYARHARHISAILGWIGDELEAHAAKHAVSPKNWGLVGDLAEMERLLRRALGHISGMDERNVDEALADLAH
jgi:hypothetical protein